MAEPKYKLTVSGEVTYSKKDQPILHLLKIKTPSPKQFEIAIQELEESIQNPTVTIEEIRESEPAKRDCHSCAHFLLCKLRDRASDLSHYMDTTEYFISELYILLGSLCLEYAEPEEEVKCQNPPKQN